MVHVAPGAAAVNPYGVGRRDHGRAAQATEVDHECVIPDTEPASVVSSAADGESHVVLPREVDAGDHVGDIGTPNKGCRSPVNRSVIDGPGLVVARVRGECESAP
jgi:hypothetical protein